MTQRNRFEEWKARKMADPGFREAYEELGAVYELISLRITRGLTQAQLAELVGTHQSSIARLENGSRPPSLAFLWRLVRALNGDMEVRIRPKEEVDLAHSLFASAYYRVTGLPAHSVAAVDENDPARADVRTESLTL
jgi:transcriptional regulator with XRE-family HTH domain